MFHCVEEHEPPCARQSDIEKAAFLGKAEGIGVRHRELMHRVVLDLAGKAIASLYHMDKEDIVRFQTLRPVHGGETNVESIAILRLPRLQQAGAIVAIAAKEEHRNLSAPGCCDIAARDLTMEQLKMLPYERLDIGLIGDGMTRHCRTQPLVSRTDNLAYLRRIANHKFPRDVTERLWVAKCGRKEKLLCLAKHSFEAGHDANVGAREAVDALPVIPHRKEIAPACLDKALEQTGTRARRILKFVCKY